MYKRENVIQFIAGTRLEQVMYIKPMEIFFFYAELYQGEETALALLPSTDGSLMTIATISVY